MYNLVLLVIEWLNLVVQIILFRYNKVNISYFLGQDRMSDVQSSCDEHTVHLVDIALMQHYLMYHM